MVKTGEKTRLNWASFVQIDLRMQRLMVGRIVPYLGSSGRTSMNHGCPKNNSSCYMGISTKLYEDVLVYITPSLSFLFRFGAFLAT